MSSPELGLSSRYEVLREIGRGGTAVVYLATDREHCHLVAIKVLKRELAASVSAARFLREIHCQKALHHPNILPILDAAEDGDLLHFVMPYVEGLTLRERLEHDGKLAIDDVMHILSELTDAVDYAHSHNLVHRDFKPENILLDGNRVILADFGIARAIVLSASEDALSSSGIIIGTPDYMSPEQFATGAHVDASCDIYALGCVAYEMLTGEVPFPAPGLRAQAAAHHAATPRPIRTVRPELPEGVEAAVFSAMSKTPADRPPNGYAFLDSIRGAMPSVRG